MKVVVITNEREVSEEITTCNSMLQYGIDRLHVRKPHWDALQMKSFLEQLDVSNYAKISLHSHHHLVSEMGLGGNHFRSNEEIKQSDKILSKSFHTMREVENEVIAISYGFLSPIYQSISKPDYQRLFDLSPLAITLGKCQKHKIYALGGVAPSNVKKLQKLGFDGVALLGAIWRESNLNARMKVLKSVRKQLNHGD